MHRFRFNNTKQFVFWALLLSTGLWTAVTWGQNTARPTNENASTTVTDDNGSGSAEANPTASTSVITPAQQQEVLDVWPLRLIDLDDKDQFGVLFELLGQSPHVVHEYLTEFVFPEVMRHQVRTWRVWRL